MKLRQLAAQVFQMIRRKAIRLIREPSFTTSPKNLRSYKKAASNLEELSLGKFFEVTEQEWFDIYRAHAERSRDDLIPFPEEEIQVLTNNQKGLVTAKGAIDIWSTIKQSCSKVNPLERNWNVLDFGCGWGRITRLLPYYFDMANIYGVDVDDRLISSANMLLPSLHHSLVENMKPISFDDGKFDLIFANSVFSHLSEKSARYTLKEISSKVKSGGILIISILEQPEMERFYANDLQKKWITKILGAEEDAALELSQKGFIWGDTHRWDDYGIAIMTPEWIKELFASCDLNLISVDAKQHAGGQPFKIGVKV